MWKKLILGLLIVLLLAAAVARYAILYLQYIL